MSSNLIRDGAILATIALIAFIIVVILFPVRPTGVYVDQGEITGFCQERMVQFDIVKNYSYIQTDDPVQLPIANESYQITSENYTNTGKTNENGNFVAPLCQYVKYRIDISNRTFWLYPIDNYYRVTLR